MIKWENLNFLYTLKPVLLLLTEVEDGANAERMTNERNMFSSTLRHEKANMKQAHTVRRSDGEIAKCAVRAWKLSSFGSKCVFTFQLLTRLQIPTRAVKVSTVEEVFI